jgi:ribosomal protein L11 methyltransferase
MGAQDVICVDVDKKAIEIASENATINNVKSSLRLFNKNATAIDKPRNLIIANLTSKLLSTLRHHLVELLMPEGYLIISGIIEQDVQNIEEQFSCDPLALHRMLTEKEWVCYVFRKKVPKI